MEFELPGLPYKKSALEPHISEETLNFHYDKHHAGYIKKLNKLLEGETSLSGKTLEEIIMNVQPGPLFNNAAQVWNHTFYWNSMTPGKTSPQGALADAIKKDFGSLDHLNEVFSEAAAGQFGSGWAWLVKDKNDKLRVLTTKDADTPVRSGIKPLLVCDVWEHAYYIDYRNDRPRYIESFWKIVNWEFAVQNFEAKDTEFFSETRARKAG